MGGVDGMYMGLHGLDLGRRTPNPSSLALNFCSKDFESSSLYRTTMRVFRQNNVVRVGICRGV